MAYRVISDVYNCPYCRYMAARGNIYCRRCGVKFSNEDIEKMESEVSNVFGASPWNTRDRFRCLICSEFVCTSDHYCRQCGDEFDDNERQMMRANLKDLAKRNIPSLLVIMSLVLLFILFLLSF